MFRSRKATIHFGVMFAVFIFILVFIALWIFARPAAEQITGAMGALRQAAIGK